MLRRLFGAVVGLALALSAFLLVAFIAILIVSGDGQPSFAQGLKSLDENKSIGPRKVETYKVRRDRTIEWPDESETNGDTPKADGTADETILEGGKPAVDRAAGELNLQGGLPDLEGTASEALKPRMVETNSVGKKPSDYAGLIAIILGGAVFVIWLVFRPYS